MQRIFLIIAVDLGEFLVLWLHLAWALCKVALYSSAKVAVAMVVVAVAPFLMIVSAVKALASTSPQSTRGAARPAGSTSCAGGAARIV
ncbi:MAG TPA: hypothetical protein VFN21_04025 [Acidimicrobiales bacterium]|nr:hypothetical protein [Acidimicrobiales bacterium]